MPPSFALRPPPGHHRTRYPLRPLGSLFVLGLGACTGDRVSAPGQSPPVVASVVISPSSASVGVGEIVALSATARDSAGQVMSGVTIVWSVSDTERARVSSAGVLTGTTVGVDTVVAMVGSIAGRAAITVQVAASIPRTPLAVGGMGCILDVAGAASCWGYGLATPLGNGTTNTSATPVPVSGAHTFASIAAGGWDACALTPTGRVWCWGIGFDGAIGDGSDTNAVVPTGVSGGPYSSIAVGAFNACAITVTGQAYCWGDNEYGSLGDGATSVQSPPTPVSGDLQLISISVGEDIGCGVTESGAGYCWGLNTLGSLGNGTTTSSLVPVAVVGGLQWRTIQVAEGVACGLTTTGAAYCWGLGGPTGGGEAKTPTLVSSALTFASLTVGGDQACGVTPTGAGYCWGGNTYGERGTGGPIESTATPAQVTGSLTFSSIAAGDWATCGRRPDGAIYCWGIELGSSPQTMTQSPVELVGPGST